MDRKCDIVSTDEEPRALDIRIWNYNDGINIHLPKESCGKFKNCSLFNEDGSTTITHTDLYEIYWAIRMYLERG